MPIEGTSNHREILTKRALIISPNLDLLLEHEDKTRARLPSVSEMTTSSLSSRSVFSNDDSEELLVGLPPPPRHPRVKLPHSTTRAVKANLTLDTDLLARETPAKPALTSMFVQSPLSRSSSISNPFINPAPTLAELQNNNIPPSKTNLKEPSNQHISALSSHRSDSCDSQSLSPIVFTSPWSAADVDAPLPKFGDRRRQQNPVADSHTKPWRPHAKRPSTSPGYTHFSSTPYMERNESNISISSTVYPPSDKGSYSYNDPVRSNSEKGHSLSQTRKELNLNTSMDCPQISPIRFSRRLSDSWPSFSFNRSSKQDPPTPIFDSTSVEPGISRPLPRPLPPIPVASGPPLPSTTNLLDSEERADLVRKSRKLAHVFVNTPTADAIPVQEPPLSMMSRYSSESNWSRPSASQSEFELDDRRRSASLGPDDLSSMSSQGSLTPSKDQASHHVLNDTFDGGDTASVMLEADKITKLLSSTPTQSQFEPMFEEQADERRRKREKLAKLHRFLGSRVPINLVLGTHIEASSPSPYFTPIDPLYRNEDRRTTWLKRRKSSSAILSSPHWSNELERVKEELNEQEKLINVRRAVKMEKVFGVAPPQTLYHTRLCPSPLSQANKVAPAEGPSESQTGPVQRNFKRSTYMKQKPKKNARPGTADSDSHLVPKVQETSDVVASSWGTSHLNIYDSYQYSLNSLQDILAWDDRESLVELHQYLNMEEEGPSSPFEMSSVATGHRMSNASSFGRRRSLPVLPSRISLDTEYNVTAPETNDVTGFQVRRRKAAKLTQFFGVDYRELINDVLQSIEHGVKNEHNSGTLRAEEAEDLLARLRKLKIRRPKSQSFLCLN